MTTRVAPRMDEMAARPVHQPRARFALQLSIDRSSSLRHQEPKKRAN
jgi:hypothetical protein